MSKFFDKTLVLCILDGFGISDMQKHNAIYHANTSYLKSLLDKFPHSEIATSGRAVGLPDGQMGNSEVGHMNIGAGRVVMQELPKIDLSFENGNFEKSEIVQNFIKESKTIHMLAMLSDGGVHSHINHIINACNIFEKHQLEIKLHLFTDGRDVGPKTALSYIKQIKSALPNATIATISGRYYAMDRDNRWDRIKLSYDAIIEGKGNHYNSAEEAIEDAYNQGFTDEFIKPAIIGDYKGANDNESMMMANFRADRVRQILYALLSRDFNEFERDKVINFAATCGMVEYSFQLNQLISPIFTNDKLKNILPEIISNNGLKQLRIAETEKYAHVTFFFNGGKEDLYPGEERKLIPSPKVATYDLKPEMSAEELTNELIDQIQRDYFDLIIVNFANADMVGHTGNFDAAVKAVSTLDQMIEKIMSELNKRNGAILITADHGNVEEMFDEHTNQQHTSHTLNKVPLILAGNMINKDEISLKDGILSDIAPTILDLFGIEKPQEMTSCSLLIKKT